jgi:hypothetical protein
VDDPVVGVAEIVDFDPRRVRDPGHRRRFERDDHYVLVPHLVVLGKPGHWPWWGCSIGACGVERRAALRRSVREKASRGRHGTCRAELVRCRHVSTDVSVIG